MSALDAQCWACKLLGPFPDSCVCHFAWPWMYLEGMRWWCLRDTSPGAPFSYSDSWHDPLSDCSKQASMEDLPSGTAAMIPWGIILLFLVGWEEHELLGLKRWLNSWECWLFLKRTLSLVLTLGSSQMPIILAPGDLISDALFGLLKALTHVHTYAHTPLEKENKILHIHHLAIWLYLQPLGRLFLECICILALLLWKYTVIFILGCVFI